jgi:beta-mannosidase
LTGLEAGRTVWALIRFSIRGWKKVGAAMTSYRPLHEGWVLTPAQDGRAAGVPAEVRARPVPASVPGCVHTDLLAAGLIPDPYLDDNEVRLGWVGHTGWVYETEFSWTDGGEPEVDLVCAGLDTVATLTLNGVQLGQTANMHRSYAFAVRHLLVEGENRLRVRFDSAYRYAQRLVDRLGPRPNEYPDPFNFIRKMACNFGWDWGPNLVTAGIWRPIGLRGWRTARLAQVRPFTTMDSVAVRVDLSRAPASAGEWLSLSAAVAGARIEVAVPPDASSAAVNLAVTGVEPWWPRGYGEPNRHLLDVTLRSADGTVLDTWQRRIGFRSVRVDTAADADGTPFTLVVNDVPVFVRGANWIPDDAFPHRVSRERYAQRLTQACEANVNLLRVWGGGIYEADDFYDLADEHGLMVMQDFLFSCAAYPEESPLAEEVEAEARENVARLASHPSLVTWIGNNENVWGRVEWGWDAALEGRTWGAGYYFDVLPRVMSEVDPSRPYWPGSPYSGSPDRFANDPAHGTMHIWTVWNDLDYTHYRDYRPRFVAEFRLPGTTRVRHAAASAARRPAHPAVARHGAPPEGRRRPHQAATGVGGAPAVAARLRRLALPDPGQPGPRGRPRHRVLPQPASTVHGQHHVAAQRLLAGDLLVRGRR